MPGTATRVRLAPSSPRRAPGCTGAGSCLDTPPRTSQPYRARCFVENAVLGVTIVGGLYAIARGTRRPPVRVSVLYTLAVVALGPLLIYRLDLAPAALTTLAMLAWQRDRPAMAAAALA